MTGRQSKIIHSGRALLTRKPSAIFMRFVIFLRVCLLRVFSICSSRSCMTLRIEAGDKFMPGSRDKVREPTGAPVPR